MAKKRESLTDGDRLRILLERKGMNANQLANATGIPSGNLCFIMQGKRGLSRKQIATLAKYFDTESEILGL